MQLKPLFSIWGGLPLLAAGCSTGVRRAYLVLIASTIVATIAGNAIAQSSTQSAADDPFAGIEEMVVVGQSMSGSLTTTSTSVTSFDALKLESMGVNNIQDVAAFTPNLEIRSASATTPAFFIRGVGLNDFTANASSAVAVYVDDAPRNLPAIQLGLLYDTANVEVQKGPQGSGPGRNASAGAIRITTKKPTGEYDANLSIDYGNYDLVDIEGALEAPIIEDVLGWRTAFKMVRRDGIVTNRCGGKTLAQVSQPNISVCGETPLVFPLIQIQPGLPVNVNNKNVWSARTSFRFNPPGIDDMEWNFVAHVDRTDQLGPIGQHLGTLTPALGGGDIFSYTAREVSAELKQIQTKLGLPGPAQCRNNPALCTAIREQSNQVLGSHLAQRPLDKLPFEGDYNNPGYERQTSIGGTLTGDWEIGGIELKSITGFEKYDRDRLIDADYSPNTLFEFHIGDRAWQATQDLRISGELDFLPISWKTGGFYLQETLDYSQETLSTNNVITPLGQIYRQKTKSAGVFFDISWQLLDDLTLDAGARYNWEQKSFDADIFRQFRRGSTTNQSSCLFDVNIGRVPPCTRTETLDHPTGTIAFNYAFDELRSFYLKYSHGWKGLQYNARSGDVATEVTDVASPEKIDAFELGFKGNWLDDIVEVEGALFWYAYQNYQVFTFTNDPKAPPVRIVINADNASNFGAELNTTIRPIEGLVADVRFGWLETRFLDFTSSSTRPAPGGSGTQFFRLIFDYNNNQLPNAPRFKVSGGIEYAFDLNRFGRIVPRYDVNYTDDVNFDPSNGRGAPDASGIIQKPDHSIGQKAFVLQNVSLRYSAPEDQFSVILWARNITNEVYKTLAFDASGGPGFVGSLVGDPRTYGVTVRMTY